MGSGKEEGEKWEACPTEEIGLHASKRESGASATSLFIVIIGDTYIFTVCKQVQCIDNLAEDLAEAIQA